VSNLVDPRVAGLVVGYGADLVLVAAGLAKLLGRSGRGGARG
jgi:hypothetical protein